MYKVNGPGGVEFGPVDLPTLQQWARDKRVLPNTVVVDMDTGQELPAHQLEPLQATFSAQVEPPPISTNQSLPSAKASFSTVSAPSDVTGDAPKQGIATWVKVSWSIIAIIVLIGWLLPNVSSLGRGTSEGAAPSGFATGDAPSSSTSSSAPDLGDEGVLHMGNPNLTVDVAADEEARDEYVKATLAKDELGYSGLIGSGRVFTVEPGTHAKFLERDWKGSVKVRILSGERIGESGWVAHEWFQKR